MNGDTPDTLPLDSAALAHHLIDALSALQHLRIDLSRDGAKPGVKARCVRVQEELERALALIRDDK